MVAANFTLVQLRYFAEAARAGSMTVAARKLHISQPALSTAITQLERELGVTLFERVPSVGIRLTESGREIYLDAAALLTQAESLSERAGGLEGTLSGTLRIGMYLPMAPFRAPTLVQAVARRHPELVLELIEANHDELVRLLDDREIDVALAYSMAPFEAYRSEVLETIPPHAIVPPQHPLAGSSEPIELQRLARDPLILLDLPHTASYYLNLFRSVGVEPDVRFRVHGYETVRGLVGQGFGISVLNQRIAHPRTYSGARTVVVELADELTGLSVSLVRRTDEESARVEAFADVCRRLYGVPSGPGFPQNAEPAL
ncbi:LysR family transcriptional regulator [Leucobacter tardus]|uniref:LysR family transcriptional regulator n=1 Tax=Leucobacter tardus TaxID=501483 RepID=A0A939QGI6_9MICO|nr:LysR family transcriptional regulator [Leucobacter tardus]MBO2988474.1 LysR family transcriptional regulator [Leucobacter tardus]